MTLFMAVLGTGASAVCTAETLTNPLFRQRADPHIFRDASGVYFAAATVPQYDRIVLRRSKMIAGLAARPSA